MKRISIGMSRRVSCLALMVTVMNVNSACFFKSISLNYQGVQIA